jgi:hypothetical protein
MTNFFLQKGDRERGKEGKESDFRNKEAKKKKHIGDRYTKIEEPKNIVCEREGEQRKKRERTERMNERDRQNEKKKQKETEIKEREKSRQK